MIALQWHLATRRSGCRRELLATIRRLAVWIAANSHGSFGRLNRLLSAGRFRWSAPTLWLLGTFVFRFSGWLCFSFAKPDRPKMKMYLFPNRGMSMSAAPSIMEIPKCLRLYSLLFCLPFHSSPATLTPPPRPDRRVVPSMRTAAPFTRHAVANMLKEK